MKLVRQITRTFTETWLGLGLLLGIFLVLALYLTGFPQFISIESESDHILCFSFFFVGFDDENCCQKSWSGHAFLLFSF
jgi:hypothetical protein